MDIKINSIYGIDAVKTTNEIVTKDRKTILQHKEKTGKSRDPLVNERMAAFKRPRN